VNENVENRKKERKWKIKLFKLRKSERKSSRKKSDSTSSHFTFKSLHHFLHSNNFIFPLKNYIYIIVNEKNMNIFFIFSTVFLMINLLYKVA